MKKRPSKSSKRISARRRGRREPRRRRELPYKIVGYRQYFSAKTGRRVSKNYRGKVKRKGAIYYSKATNRLIKSNRLGKTFAEQSLMDLTRNKDVTKLLDRLKEYRDGDARKKLWIENAYYDLFKFLDQEIPGFKEMRAKTEDIDTLGKWMKFFGPEMKDQN